MPTSDTSDPKPLHVAAWTAALLISAFTMLGLYGLGTVPLSHVDEAWLAAPGYGFWQTGHFATPLFAGFFGMERHYYGFLPFFPILVGAALKLLGLGLAQARLVPLALSVATLILTYRVGSRLLSPIHGAVSIFILTLWPVALPLPHLTTGVPLFDLARHVRNDIAVAAFGMAMLFVALPLLRGEEMASRFRLFGVGFLGGFTLLSHVYGGAWSVAIVIGLALRPLRIRTRDWLVFFLGLLLPLLPFFLFVAAGWNDFFDQNRNYGSRVALLDPGFVLRNLSHEIDRYRNVAAQAARGHAAPWLFVAGIGIGLVVLFTRRVERARTLLIALGSVAFLFALLLEPKNFTYMATLWPLWALTASAGLVFVFQKTRRRTLRATLLVIALVPAAEGVSAYLTLARRIARTTPDAEHNLRIAAAIPPGSRVLGMHTVWFGLAKEFPTFRSAFVPIVLTNPRFTRKPLTFQRAADDPPCDIFLVDQSLLDFMKDASDARHPFHRLGTEMRAYIDQAALLTAFEDPSHGRIEIYRVTPRS